MPPLASQAPSAVDDHDDAQPAAAVKQTWSTRTLSYLKRIVHHIRNHVGVGIICAVAYFDPGNWSVDLQAGSQFGYRPMLFVMLIAGLGAMVLQSLAFKLGCVTGLDLATHCRILLHDRPRHRRLIRYLVLYPLYGLSEIAIISTDLAELLGSAIGLCLLFPTLPLWAAVLLTASDVLIFLIIGDPSRGGGRPVKVFEYCIIVLVFGVMACFIVLLVRISPPWGQVFLGFLPSKKLFSSNPDALYTAVGILGATVMPHALFLGSFLATQDRVGGPSPTLPRPVGSSIGDINLSLIQKLKRWATSLFQVTRAERIAASRDYRDKYGHENKELSFIKAHYTHGLVDVIASLIFLAVPINSAILVIAADIFFDPGTSMAAAGLFDAFDIVKSHIGQAAAILFALALLCSGQTASITATLAGQIVSEGFIEWRISPFLRRIITRMIGLIPSMVVAIAVGRDGINTLLVASQVVLSIVLPFVAFPLICLTSMKSVMRVRKPTAQLQVPVPDEKKLPLEPVTTDTRGEDSPQVGSDRSVGHGMEIMETIMEVSPYAELLDALEEVQVNSPALNADIREEKRGVRVQTIPLSDNVEDEWVDYSNGWILTILVSAIFIVILAANLYVIVMLGLGKS